MWQRILSQAKKELAQFSRDRLSVGLALVLPLGMLLIYGLALRLEAKNIPLGVQDFDRSPLSRSYVERLFATNQFVPTPMVGTSPLTALDRGEVKATVVIPPTFSTDVAAGHAQVQVLIDGTDVNNARVIQNSIRAVTNFFNQIQIQGDRPAMQRINAQVRIWFNPGRRESLYIVPGVFGIVLWAFPSMLAAIAVVREKEQGTIAQVYASDLTATEWLLGKGFAYWLVAIAEAVVLLIASMTLFHLRFQVNPLYFVVNTGIYLAAAIAFGLLIGANSATQNSAVQGTAITGFMTSFLLSGFMYRVENIPFPLSLISHITPARYYIILSRDTFLRGGGWLSTWPVPLLITAIGCLCFLVARQKLKQMQFPD